MRWVWLSHFSGADPLPHFLYQVNCPKAGVAFYNKLDINDKKLIEYEVRLLTSMHICIFIYHVFNRVYIGHPPRSPSRGRGRPGQDPGGVLHMDRGAPARPRQCLKSGTRLHSSLQFATAPSPAPCMCVHDMSSPGLLSSGPSWMATDVVSHTAFRTPLLVLCCLID